MSGKATISIVGRLARDPEARFTADGKAVTTFSIPVQERKDGETTWYKITAWEKQAEVINQYATKGMWLVIEGVPKIETWEDKSSGVTRAQMAVTLRSFTFCGGGERDNAPQEATQEVPARPVQPRTAPSRATTPTAAGARRNVAQPIESDADLPF